MFFSKRLNLLFVAAPKTGTRTVENALYALDPHGERFRITLEDRTIDSSCVETISVGHATARDLRQALGADFYRSLSTFGFVRNPIEKIVSAYNFSRQRSIRKLFKMKNKSKAKLVKIVAGRVVSITIARILPYSLWAVLFPMKKCSNYFLDDSGEVIVDCLGSTERLSEDLREIVTEFGVSPDELDVPHLNKSRRKSSQTNVRPGLLYRYLAWRYAEDMKLYSLVESGIFVKTRHQSACRVEPTK